MTTEVTGSYLQEMSTPLHALSSCVRCYIVVQKSCVRWLRPSSTKSTPRAVLIVGWFGKEPNILLPRSVRYIFLSATIPDAMQFKEWILIPAEMVFLLL